MAWAATGQRNSSIAGQGPRQSARVSTKSETQNGRRTLFVREALSGLPWDEASRHSLSLGGPALLLTQFARVADPYSHAQATGRRTDGRAPTQSPCPGKRTTTKRPWTRPNIRSLKSEYKRLATRWWTARNAKANREANNTKDSNTNDRNCSMICCHASFSI